MSRLYASIDSDARKTQATSRGNKEISAHVRGWDSGVRISAWIEDGQDVFGVYETGGSNDPANHRLLAVIGKASPPQPSKLRRPRTLAAVALDEQVRKAAMR
jgi:hypothetical protein